MKLDLYNINISGLNTLLIPNTNTDIISIGMFIRAGSNKESIKNNGIAHLLEHLMFKSTVKRPQKKLLDDLDNLGAKYNAGTTRDFTYYEIMGNKNDLDKILDLIFDLYCNPVYDSNTIELEKGVVMEEKKMNLDNSLRVLSDYIMSEIFKGTPFEKLIIGTEESIKNITLNDVHNFHKQYYTLDNSLLVISGNFKKNNTISLVKDIFKNYKLNNLRSKSNNTNIKYKIINNNKANIFIVPNKTMNQSYNYINFYLENLSFEEENIVEFICKYLSSGSTSKLFELLRNKLGGNYSNDSDYIALEGKYGLFQINFDINSEYILKSLKEVLIILKNLKTIEINENDIKKIKKSYESDYIFKINNPNYLMAYHGENYLFGKKYNMLDEYESMQKINVTDIKDFANKYLIKKNMYLFCFGQNIEPSDLATIVNDF
jgi:predicted Zn-dependent peptidase